MIKGSLSAFIPATPASTRSNNAPVTLPKSISAAGAGAVSPGLRRTKRGAPLLLLLLPLPLPEGVVVELLVLLPALLLPGLGWMSPQTCCWEPGDEDEEERGRRRLLLRVMLLRETTRLLLVSLVAVVVQARHHILMCLSR